MNHIRTHKHDLPMCQEAEKTRSALVWKLLKSLTNPPSIQLLEKMILQDESQCWWQSHNQVGKKGHYSLPSLSTSPCLPPPRMKQNQCCSQPRWEWLKSLHTVLDVSLTGGVVFSPHHLYLRASILVALLAISEWIKKNLSSALNQLYVKNTVTQSRQWTWFNKGMH